jgi:hypothetical protein
MSAAELRQLEADWQRADFLMSIAEARTAEPDDETEPSE